MKNILRKIFYLFYNRLGNVYIKLIFYKPFFNFFYKNERKQYARYFTKYNNSKIDDLVKKIKNDGIAFIHFDDLFNNIKFNDFRSWCLDAIDNDLDHSKGRKNYIDYFLDYDKIDNYSLLKKVLNDQNLFYVISSYLLNTTPKLNYFRIWRNNITSEKPKDSQLWHRDGDNLIICKCFIYLEDIDEDNGATEYIKKSNYFGDLYSLNPSKAPKANYLDSLPNKFLENKIIASGKAGTVMFVDTSGFHKGGRCTKNDRKLFTSTFSLTHSFNKSKSNIIKSSRSENILSKLLR